MTAIKAVIFDKDGTVFHFEDTWSAMSRAVINALAQGEEGLARRLADAVGFDWVSGGFTPGSVIVAGSIEDVVAAWRKILPEVSAEEIYAVSDAHMEDLPLVPVCDLHVLLNALKAQGLKLAVATNDTEASAKYQLQKAGVLTLFDFVAGADSGFGAKPEAGMLLGCAEAMGVAPDTVVMVGDSTHDLNAGRNAGAALCVGVLTGPSDAAELAPIADVVLPSIAELPAALQDRS